jgi:hypothetical protein
MSSVNEARRRVLMGNGVSAASFNFPEMAAQSRVLVPSVGIELERSV